MLHLDLHLNSGHFEAFSLLRAVRPFLIILLITTGISCTGTGKDKSDSNGEKKAYSKEQQAALDSLDQELSQISDNGKIIGFGVAIVSGSETVYARGHGFSDIKKKTPYSEHSLQNIASISKTFLGIALIKAQELGKLSLDDPINDYLPFEINNPKFKKAPITIRHLTTHTSSIVDTDIYNEKAYVLKDPVDRPDALKDLYETFNPPEDSVSMEEFLKRTLNSEGSWYSPEGFLDSAPGKTFEYSNVGAALAALVLEKATGMDYTEFSKKYVLDPIGMNSSGWNFESIDLEKHSKLYQPDLRTIPFYRLVTYPDGGLICSVADLGTYLRELIRGYRGNGSLLSKEGYEELFQPRLSDSHFSERDSESPFNDEYDMGVFMGISAKGYIGHSGGDPGVSTLMFFNSQSETGQILFVNTGLDDSSLKDFIKIWMTTLKYRERFDSLNQEPGS